MTDENSTAPADDDAATTAPAKPRRASTSKKAPTGPAATSTAAAKADADADAAAAAADVPADTVTSAAPAGETSLDVEELEPSGEAPKVRRLTLKIVAVIAAVILVVGGIITFIAVRAAMDSAAASTQVLRFDAAYRDTDCALFESVTTPTLRDYVLGQPYDCDIWQSAAEGLTVDGDYVYTVKIDSVAISGDTATITTREGYEDSEGVVQTIPFTYTLIRTETGWVISEYANS